MISIYYLLVIAINFKFSTPMQPTTNKTALLLINQHKGQDYYIAQFKIPDLSIFTYYVQSEGETYLVDPPIDIQFLLDKARQRNATLKYILLTHYHVDYLAGHVQINVPVIMGQHSKRQKHSFDLRQLKDNQSFNIGKLKTTLIYTPGHTIESSCFLVQKVNGEHICLFTGDTLLLGEVGRPNANQNQQFSSQELAGMLFDSLQKLKSLNGDIRLYPGHGSGSICGRSIHKGEFCTLQNQLQTNYAFSIDNKEDFIRNMTSGPSHHNKISMETSQKNQIGVDEPFQSMMKQAHNPLTIQQFKQLSKKYTIIDTRKFAQTTGIIRGSYWLPGQTIMSSWICMALKPNQPYLVVTDIDLIDQILQRNIRMGYLNCKGYNNFDMKQYDGEMDYPLLRNLKQLGDTEKKLFLDVRTPSQWQHTGVIRGAKTLQLRKLDNLSQKQLSQLKQLQTRKLIVIHCKSGLRSKLAASILLRHGLHPAVLIQNVEDFIQLGLKVVTPKENDQYWMKKTQKKLERYARKKLETTQIESSKSQEQENQNEKNAETQNMNRMQVEECYEECLKSKKSPDICQKQCTVKSYGQSPFQQENMQHSLNRNQQQARKGGIVSSTKRTQYFISKEKKDQKQQRSIYSDRHMNSIEQSFKKTLQGIYNKNYEQALTELNKQIENQKDSSEKNSQLYINRSVCFMKIGNGQKAKQDLQTAIRIDPTHPIAYFNLASYNVMVRKKLKQKVEQIQEQKQKVNENQQEKKQLKSADEQLLDPMELDLKTLDLEALDLKILDNLYCSLSCLYLKRGMKSQQLQDFLKAIQFSPNNFEARVMKGLKHLKMNDLKDSFEQLKVANKLTRGKNQTIRGLLEKLEHKINGNQTKDKESFGNDQTEEEQHKKSAHNKEKEQENPEVRSKQQTPQQKLDVYEEKESSVQNGKTKGLQQSVSQVSSLESSFRLIGKQFIVPNISQPQLIIQQQIQKSMVQFRQLYEELFANKQIHIVQSQL